MVADWYRRISAAIDYVEEHLDDELSLKRVGQKSGLSAETLRALFPLLTQNTFGEYVRKRRLTLAGRDLLQSPQRIIDLAMKYQYASAEAFSRAFAKFHGILPSEVRRSPERLRFFPRAVFQIPHGSEPSGDYEIVELDELQLYGLSIATDNAHIRDDAPQLFRELARVHPKLNHPDYGLVHYGSGRTNLHNYHYWVLWRAEQAEQAREYGLKLREFRVQRARFLKFRILSQESADIQSSSRYFYDRFWPSCAYHFAARIELEYYHDGVTDFLVPIQKLE